MTRYLHHVTLTTGHVRRSSGDEVGDAVIASLHDFIAAMITGGRPAIPNFPGYTMTGTGEGKCLLGTVWRGDAPVVTIGIAGRSTCGAKLWQILHQTLAAMPPLATAGQPCPPEPWCAARLEVGGILDHEAMTWVGDFERCLAWAWLGRRS